MPTTFRLSQLGLFGGIARSKWASYYWGDGVHRPAARLAANITDGKTAKKWEANGRAKKRGNIYEMWKIKHSSVPKVLNIKKTY